MTDAAYLLLEVLSVLAIGAGIMLGLFPYIGFFAMIVAGVAVILVVEAANHIRAKGEWT